MVPELNNFNFRYRLHTLCTLRISQQSITIQANINMINQVGLGLSQDFWKKAIVNMGPQRKTFQCEIDILCSWKKHFWLLCTSWKAITASFGRISTPSIMRFRSKEIARVQKTDYSWRFQYFRHFPQLIMSRLKPGNFLTFSLTMQLHSKN